MDNKGIIVLTLRALVRLTRLSSSLLCALPVFVAFMGRTKSFSLSLGNAMPLLFIGMCTFIANDLEDLEKDRLIHPERPLPARNLTPEFAAILYFISLGVALFSTRYFVAQDIAFWYYGLAVLSISYVYVVDGLPSLKTVYVAVASSIPVLIIARWFPKEPRLYVIAVAVFLFTLGREICGDIQDRAGDAPCYIHGFKPSSLAVVAFSLSAVGIVLLAFEVRRPGEIADLVAMTLILAMAALYWFKFGQPRRATLLMKMQLFVGLYLLV